MKVRSRLHLISMFSLATAVAVTLGMFYSSSRIDLALTKNRYAERLVSLAFNLQTRLRYVVTYGSREHQDAWRQVQRRLRNTLTQAPSLSPQQSTLLSSIDTHSAGNKALFEHLLQLHDNTPDSPRAGELAKAARQHLVDRLYAGMTTIMEDSLQLETLAQSDIRRTLGIAQIATTLLLFGVAAVMTLLAIVMARGIRHAISGLRAGVRRVAGGDLEHEIGPGANDELGDLASNFDLMIRQLRETCHSRDALQAVVEERTRKLERANAILKKLADIDPLTGTLNRRCFFERGRMELRRAERHQRPVSLLMLDCDRFKDINDRHGHATGDRALRHLCTLCTGLIRDEDLMARYGGEEFTILLPETDIEGAMQMAERIRATVEAQPIQEDDQIVALTVSIGVGILGANADDIETLVNNADRALLAAKRLGRNRVERFPPPG